MKREIKQSQSILQLDELKARKRVLRRLNFATADDVITLKGRVACEISTGDECTLTELIFAGVFNDLDVPQTVALLSCFAFGERSKDSGGQIQPALAAPLRQVQDTARRIAKISNDSKLPVDEEDFVEVGLEVSFIPSNRSSLPPNTPPLLLFLSELQSGDDECGIFLEPGAKVFRHLQAHGRV